MRTPVFFAALALLTIGCDPDDGGTDAGFDAGTTVGVDSGVEIDAGTDAGGLPDAGVDAGPPCEGPPGLYEDGSCTVLAAGLRAYEPQFELWTDGATKERHIFIPDGLQIDTTNPDNWVYPVGTRIYKTFSLDGMRLETRLLEKTRAGVGVGSWSPTVYAWNMAQNSVTDVTNAAPAELENVLGTTHDIPDGRTCLRCHLGRDGHDMVNGFSAFQINYDGAGVSYQDLLDDGDIANAFPAADAVAPGDATAIAGLGYLHANCGYCHRPGGDPAAEGTGFFMRLEVGASATVEATTAYRTGVNTPGRNFGDALCRFMPGNPTNSTAVHRMSSREIGILMPPLATEVAHPAGIAEVSAWVNGLSVAADPACSP